MEDFRAIASSKTPLFADIRREQKVSSIYVTGLDHRLEYDEELSKVLRLSYGLTRSPARPYILGTLTGTWEGSYMASPCLANTPAMLIYVVAFKYGKTGESSPLCAW
jgi:hypothetical protein